MYVHVALTTQDTNEFLRCMGLSFFFFKVAKPSNSE